MDLLLADDSLAIQKVMTLSFQKSSYRVSVVNSFSDMKEALSSSQRLFRLLICDVNLAGLDRAQDLKDALSEYPHLKVLMLKGSFDPFDEQAFFKAGFSHVLAKPFTVAQMLARVQALVPTDGAEGYGASSQRPRGGSVNHGGSVDQGGSVNHGESVAASLREQEILREEGASLSHSMGGASARMEVGEGGASHKPWQAQAPEELPHLPPSNRTQTSAHEKSYKGAAAYHGDLDQAAFAEPYPGAQQVMRGASAVSSSYDQEDQQARYSDTSHKFTGAERGGEVEKNTSHASGSKHHLSSVELDLVAAEVWSRIQVGLTKEVEKGLDKLVSQGLEKELRDLIRLELRSLVDERARL